MNEYMKSQYSQLVSFLGVVFTNSFEFILFEINNNKLEIIESSNLKDGSIVKATEFVKSAVQKKKKNGKNCFFNYAIKIMDDKLSKMSVFLFDDEKGETTGALCVCMRCDTFIKIEAFISSFLTFKPFSIDDNDEVNNYSISEENLELSLERIEEYVDSFGYDPNHSNHNERTEIICDLYDMGIYNLKGAVAHTAEVLGMSDKSVYRYIAQIKKARE